MALRGKTLGRRRAATVYPPTRTRARELMPATARTRYKGGSKYQPSDQDRRTVAAMISVGINQNAICAVLDITVPTLHRHFRNELNISYIKLKARMRARLVAKAESGDTLALIFVNKVLGWNEYAMTQGGGSAEVDFASLTDSEIIKRILRLQRRTAVARATNTKPPRSVH